MRYFLARILQYQFYEAACEQAGWTRAAASLLVLRHRRKSGHRFNAMLALGQSQPWQDALEAFTGERSMDASAILAYYAAVDGVAEGAERRQDVRLVTRARSEPCLHRSMMV